MESSGTLVAPVARAFPQHGFRARLWLALNVVVDQPRLWAFGALGFALRGGIVALAAPIIVLPTQVEARALLGDNLGSTGFTGAFFVGLAAGALATTLLLVAVLVGLTAVERASFERIAGKFPKATRRTVLYRLFAVQLVTALAIALCAVPVALAAAEVAYSEVVRPTGAGSLYDRVLAGIAAPVFVLLFAVLVMELLSALTTREVLVRSQRQTAGRLWLLAALAAALTLPLRSPIRTLVTGATAWAITLAALLPAAWLISLSWQSVRGSYLTSLSLGETSTDVGMLIIATGLAAAFVLGILATGFASALRGALWSVERLS